MKLLFKRLYRHRMSYVFIAPFYIMFLIFTVFPILWSGRLSLFEMESMTKPETFIGAKNFAALLNPTFFQSIRNTFYYTAVQVPTMIALALVLALLLNQALRGRALFRYTIFMPMTCSLVVAGLIFIMIYSANAGLVNYLLRSSGLPRLARDWLQDPITAMPAVILVADWRWTGYQMIIILAGLQGINSEYYEAARVDGASTLQVIRHITIPLLYPTLFFVAIMAVIGSLRIFDEPYVLTKITGPVNSTLTMVGYLFIEAFQYYKLGFAAAIGWAIVVITGIISWFFMRFLSERAGLR